MKHRGVRAGHVLVWRSESLSTLSCRHVPVWSR